VKIGLDLDGVFIDWDRGWRKDWNREALHPKVPNLSDTWNAPFRDTKLTPAEFFIWMRSRQVWLKLWTYPGALDTVYRWAKEGHDVHFVTHRPWTSRVQTIQYLQDRNLYELPIHFVKNKGDVDAQVFIDDDPKIIEQLHNEGRHVVRVHRPWNWNVDGVHTIDAISELELARP